jgi:Rieske Fe-S protein
VSEQPKTAGQPEPQDETNRRRFLVQATVAMGTVVGLGMVVPLAPTLWPKPELINANKGWSPLTKAEFAQLKASLDKPVKINFVKKNVTDGYLVSDNDYYVWGVHMTAAEESKFRQERPDLFDPKLRGDVNFDVGTLGFVLFSSLCPHLNCKYAWDDGLKAFLCPCHGSQFSKSGVHMRKPSGEFIGPSPRDLDPIPFREQGGIAEVEWVKYKANESSRIIVAYS